MQKVVIFSAGGRGNIVYGKMSLFFEVIAYCDNDPTLWGKKCNEILIVPPCELPEIFNKAHAKVFIVNEKHWSNIARQLDAMGIQDYINLDAYLSYFYDGYLWMPVSFSKPEPYVKQYPDDFAVLYVQDKPCTRTTKIATALKACGVLTYLAYTAAPSDSGEKAFTVEYPFWTYSDLLEFVNQSAFDVIHCSNMPEELINVLLHSNKKIIYDMHDVTTAFPYYTSSQSLLEYIANTQADGVIYVTEKHRDTQIEKYNVAIEKTFSIGNYPLKSFSNVKKKTKLSAKDEQIHCVFEGSLATESALLEVPYLYFEPLWVKLAQRGVHVHIYSQLIPEYCRSLEKKNPLIHYEGNLRDEALIGELSKYDVGLLMYNTPDCGDLNCASANKLTEYFAAGLPVVSNVPAYIELLERKQCGGKLDLDKDDIIKRLDEIRKITIPADFCDVHKFTMDAYAEELIEFYKKVIRSGNREK